MKIQLTEGQVWWIALPDEIRPERGVDGPLINTGLQSIFGFSAPPVAVKDGGAEFLNGKLSDGDDQILISKLTVFNDGMNVQVPTNTENAEKVLQRALQFFFEVGVRHPSTPPLHFYSSTIVADFDGPLENIFPPSLLNKISKAMPFKGHSDLFSISTNFDASKIADGRWRGINPSLFKIERRINVPYDVNRYFSVANMKSADHIETLSDFERFTSKTI
jgi:hypothetical protein